MGRVEAERDAVLGRFVDASHFVSPSALPGFVALHARHMGAVEAVLYVISYEQRYLQPLGGDGVPKRDPLEVDGTLGGRAYRSGKPVDADAAAGDTGRLWVPLLDGTTRLGVLEMTFQAVDDDCRRAARQFAGLVSEMVVSRNLYGDTFARARRRRDMTLAAEMQWSLLPPQTFSDRRLTVTGVLEPAYSIAGDSFDYAYDDDVLSFAIIDAMGHGFEAMILASVAVGAYRHSRRAGRGLADTYAAMDEVLSAQFGPDRFVTAQLGELHARSGDLRWLNAGHPQPLLVRGGRVIGTLECAPTFPIGFGGAVAEIADYRLEPDDHLLFYTDGVVEARSPDGEFFGDERLGDLLVRALATDLPEAETVRRLSHAILAHQQGGLQDDATTLLVSWHGREPDQAVAEVEAEADAPSGPA